MTARQADEGVVREVELPAATDDVWDALTAADRVAAWFGADVAWELRPGGRATFVDDDGTRRAGEVDEVVAGRRLRFRWWPADGDGDGPGADASVVTYELEPVPAGTRLVVTEVPVAPTAWVRSGRAAPSASAWDVRLVGLWAGCHAPLAVRA